MGRHPLARRSGLLPDYSFILSVYSFFDIYVEFANDTHLKRASTFVLRTVVPQFGLVPHAAETSRLALGTRVGAWLLGLAEPSIDVLYDFHADMDLLEGSLSTADLWPQLEPVLVPTHVGYMYREPAVTMAMEASWEASFAAEGIGRHHALADARALRAGYFALHSGGQTP